MSRRIDHFTHHSQTNAHNAQHTSLLQDIKTNTANIKLEAETIDVNVADLEVLQTAANVLLTTANTNSAHISDNLDHLSSNIDQVNTNLGVLSLIDGELEGITPLLETANINTAHISDNLDHLSSNLDTMNNNLNPALNNIEAELEEHKPIHEATNTKLDTINTTLTGGGVVNISTLATHAKQDTINSTLGNLATESTLQIISEDFTKCDTDNVVITGSVLPTGASTSGNQTTINTTLGTINNQFRTQWSNGNGTGTALGPAVGLLATGAQLNSLITANHNDIIATKDRIDFLISQQSADLHLQHDKTDHLSGDLDTLEHSVNALEGKQDDTITAINQTKTQVNALITANHDDIIATKDRIDFLISQQSADLHLQHDKTDHLSGDLDTLEHSVNALEGKQDDTITAINQTKTQVNALITANHDDIIATKDRIDFLISQQSADLHLQHDKTDHLSANLDTLEGSLSSMEGKQDNLLVKQTLATTAKDTEVIDDDAISPETLSIAIDTENFERVRFYGNTSTSAAVLGGTDLLVYGSNSSTGTYYNIPQATFQTQTLTISGGSAVHHIGLELQNTPRFIKIFNKSSSSTYTIVKLRMVGSGGRLVV